MGTVTIIEQRFTEDEISVYDADGSVAEYMDPPTDDAHVTRTVFAGLSAREAADMIQGHGLTFAATGNDWAAHPDGSYISNYATGERVATTAHLSDFPGRVTDAIMDVVG